MSEVDSYEAVDGLVSELVHQSELDGLQDLVSLDWGQEGERNNHQDNEQDDSFDHCNYLVFLDFVPVDVALKVGF